MAYDFFVSYARADNAAGWITAFIKELQEEQRRFTGGREFRVFFDTSDIRSLDDWRHAIQEKLAASRLLVAFLSPHYFASEWCRREWRAWIDVEIAKHILSDGAARVYVVEVPWLASAMSEQQVAAAIARLTQRPPADLQPGTAADALKVAGEMAHRQLTEGERTDPQQRGPIPFFASVQDFQTTGLAALRREDLRKVLASLAKDLSVRSEHVQAAAGSRSTIPPYNRRFVGRLEELTLLRERLHQGRTGVISGHKGDLPKEQSVIASVHGLGGIGKTELAFTYAHAFAGLYPGGRFLVPCDGRSDLRLAMLALDEIFRDQISDEQRKTLDLHFGAIRDGLRRRLHELGRILLVLDNVTDAALLSPEQTDTIRTLGQDLHLLATTRLGAPESGGAFDDVHWLTLGELSFEDSLRLLEKHRAFDTPEEQGAVESIARRLGGFALCVEVVGAYLGQHPEQSYAQFLATMGLEDLAPVDLAAERRDVVTRRHNNEKRLRAILDHTLNGIGSEAMSALHFASLLSPDHIVLPWLSKLVGDVHPALATDAIAWPRLIARLVSLALLTRGEDGEAQALDESHQPRVLRCHRLLQDYLRAKSDAEEKTARQKAVDALVRERDAALKKTTRWGEARWELDPMDALAVVWKEGDHPEAAWLANMLGVRWRVLAQWTRAESAIRRALTIYEGDFGRVHPSLTASLNNLALLLQETNRLSEAELMMRRALAIDEADFGPEHHRVATDLNNLVGLLYATNRLPEAEPLIRRALAIEEASYGLDHPNVTIPLNNLASLLQTTNRLSEAESLMRRALAINESHLSPEHPELAAGLHNLATLLYGNKRFTEAEPLVRRALAINESSYGAEHPSVAANLGLLSLLLLDTNRLVGAEPLMRRALAIDEGSYGLDHPNVAIRLDNLAQLLKTTDRLVEAEPLMRRALAIKEASLGPEHPAVAISLNNLAALLRATNRSADAEPLMRRMLVAFVKFTSVTHHQHPELNQAMRNYGAVLESMGLPVGEAMQRIQSALREGGISV